MSESRMSGEPHVRIDRGRLAEPTPMARQKPCTQQETKGTEPARPTGDSRTSRLPYHLRWRRQQPPFHAGQLGAGERDVTAAVEEAQEAPRHPLGVRAGWDVRDPCLHGRLVQQPATAHLSAPQGPSRRNLTDPMLAHSEEPSGGGGVHELHVVSVPHTFPIRQVCGTPRPRLRNARSGRPRLTARRGRRP